MKLLDKSAHYYDLFGNTCHTQPDGTHTTIDQAKTQGIFPSVTSILGVVHEEFLDLYKAKKIIEATLSQEPKGGREAIAKYERRIIEEAERELDESANWGSAVHNALELYFMSGIEIPKEMRVFTDPSVQWMESNLSDVVAMEKVIVSPSEGYAGTVDVIGKIKRGTGIYEAFGEDVVLDFKNNKTHPRYPIEPRKKYMMQLAAYGNEVFSGAPFPAVNLVMSRNEPGRFAELVYRPDKMKKMWGMFKCARDLFYCMNEWER